MPAGRKSLREELGIIRRYAELTEPYFKFIAEMLHEDSDKDDRKWAAERLDKAFPKMIPQDINADLGGTLLVQWLSQSLTPQGNGSSGSTTQQSDGLSSSSTEGQEKQQQSSTTSSETHS